MLFAKTIKRQGEYIIELEKNLKITKKNSKDTQKLLLTDFIMTINEVQDVQAMKDLSEQEKDKRRNMIINRKLKKYITKLTELENDGNQITNS